MNVYYVFVKCVLVLLLHASRCMIKVYTHVCVCVCVCECVCARVRASVYAYYGVIAKKQNRPGGYFVQMRTVKLEISK